MKSIDFNRKILGRRVIVTFREKFSADGYGRFTVAQRIRLFLHPSRLCFSLNILHGKGPSYIGAGYIGGTTTFLTYGCTDKHGPKEGLRIGREGLRVGHTDNANVVPTPKY